MMIISIPSKPTRLSDHQSKVGATLTPNSNSSPNPNHNHNPNPNPNPDPDLLNQWTGSEDKLYNYLKPMQIRTKPDTPSRQFIKQYPKNYTFQHIQQFLTDLAVALF